MKQEKQSSSHQIQQKTILRWMLSYLPVLLIPLIFLLPFFFSNKVFGVFVAEPVSDIIAASVTAFMLFTRINGILDQGAGEKRHA